jgi:hypothetical protein
MSEITWTFKPYNREVWNKSKTRVMFVGADPYYWDEFKEFRKEKNKYGIPRNDINRYTQLFGIVIGLIFSSELFDAVSTLLTPSETIILSEAEYEKKNIK